MRTPTERCAWQVSSPRPKRTYIRFVYRGKGSFDRRPLDRLLKTIDGFKKR